MHCGFSRESLEKVSPEHKSSSFTLVFISPFYAAFFLFIFFVCLSLSFISLYSVFFFFAYFSFFPFLFFFSVSDWYCGFNLTLPAKYFTILKISFSLALHVQGRGLDFFRTERLGKIIEKTFVFFFEISPQC